MLEGLAWVCEAGLLEILLRNSTCNRLLEIHLEFRHELLVLRSSGCVSTSVVGEVTLHVGCLLLWHVVKAVGVHLVRLGIGRGEGA